MKRLTRRAKLHAAAPASVAGLATVTLTATAGAAPATVPAHGTAPRKPAVVLVHGAFADASSWNGVVRRLEHDGYR
ncbi:hypothetical protein GCM10010448_10150 [Streptomyces glomeratus]|uniref:Alpha/beta hydrolase n=1 Tax=Streptomyces glomeratus TaxID=284452 RepID=A0ABP6L4S1_9ACTN